MNDDQAVVLSEEDQELAQVFGKYARYPKLMRWIQLFLDQTNKETFGNRTAAALVAYSLDRNDPSQYNSARHIGYENYAKVHTVAADLITQNGWTVDKQLELLTAKATGSTNAKYLQMLLEITHVYNPKALVQVQTNTQINTNPTEIQELQISPEEEKQLSREFSEFLNAKYVGKPAMNPDAPQGTTG